VQDFGVAAEMRGEHFEVLDVGANDVVAVAGEDRERCIPALRLK
jgi:hypothetical protein